MSLNKVIDRLRVRFPGHDIRYCTKAKVWVDHTDCKIWKEPGHSPLKSGSNGAMHTILYRSDGYHLAVRRDKSSFIVLSHVHRE